MIERFNEFLNNNYIDEDVLFKLIEAAEHTNLADLEMIAQREPYRKVVSMGKKVIPYIINRGLLWDRGLSEITGEGLNPMEYNSKIRVEYWKKWKIDNGY